MSQFMLVYEKALGGYDRFDDLDSCKKAWARILEAGSGFTKAEIESMLSIPVANTPYYFDTPFGGAYHFLIGNVSTGGYAVIDQSGSGSEVATWADEAMYHAAPDENVLQGERPEPVVTLVTMTPKPLQTLAAAAGLYEGKVWRNPADVTMAEADKWFRDMTRTALQAPLEFVDLHFLFEGVTRALTHQLVRQRTAVFVQESMRFAVKDNAADNVALPPSLADLAEDHPMRVVWNRAERGMGWAYNALVDGGVPAEDARGLLPTNITTKVHYKTNLRNLAEHAGMRLCSQAQFEWKQVWAQMLQQIEAYGPRQDTWQQRAIVRLFKPVCYRTGRCEFRAATDRWCTIRERVEAHHAKGEDPVLWLDIDPREPLVEGAARRPPGV